MHRRERCAWRSRSAPTTPRSAGSPASWPGSAGWVWPSPAGSTRPRSWRSRSARSAPGRVVALLGVSPSLAADERAAAHDVARHIGVPVVEVRRPARATGPSTGPTGPTGASTARTSCSPPSATRCSTGTGSTGSPTARTPTTCAGPTGPARRAATRHRVLRPLADAGLDKAAVRRIARALGAAVRRQAGRAVPRVADPAPRAGDAGEAAPRSRRPSGRCGRSVSPTAGYATTATSPGSSCPPGRSSGRSPSLREQVHRAVAAAGFRFVAVDLAGIQSGAFTLPLVTVGRA